MRYRQQAAEMSKVRRGQPVSRYTPSHRPTIAIANTLCSPCTLHLDTQLGQTLHRDHARSQAETLLRLQPVRPRRCLSLFRLLRNLLTPCSISRTTDRKALSTRQQDPYGSHPKRLRHAHCLTIHPPRRTTASNSLSPPPAFCNAQAYISIRQTSHPSDIALPLSHAPLTSLTSLSLNHILHVHASCQNSLLFSSPIVRGS